MRLQFELTYPEPIPDLAATRPVERLQLDERHAWDGRRGTTQQHIVTLCCGLSRGDRPWHMRRFQRPGPPGFRAAGPGVGVACLEGLLVGVLLEEADELHHDALW